MKYNDKVRVKSGLNSIIDGKVGTILKVKDNTVIIFDTDTNESKDIYLPNGLIPVRFHLDGTKFEVFNLSESDLELIK